jgi:hypothetical protein
MSIDQKIQAWFEGSAGEPHARFRSWEHCYGFFRRAGRSGVKVHQDHAALHLAFFLASWGMFRGSAFSLKHAYTIHRGVVATLGQPRFALLWEREFGAKKEDANLIPTILAARDAVREAYEPFGNASDILIGKVLLGTLACLPACDRYFIWGFRRSNLKFSGLNEKFVERVFGFCRENLTELRKAQSETKRSTGMRYPLMKLVDMYFSCMGY